MIHSRRLTTAAALFAVFWCIGVCWMLPQMENKLLHAAQTALAAQNTLAGRLERMQLGFDGQSARLTGHVRSLQDRQVAEVTLRDHVRASSLLAPAYGAGLNPVHSVRNELEVSPFPAGWMLLAIQGGSARLIGTAATGYEARDLANSIADKWSAEGGHAAGSLQHDLRTHDEAANISTTLKSIPAPVSGTQAANRVELHLTQIGREWEKLPLQETTAHLLARASAVGVSPAEWTAQVAPLIDEMSREDRLATQREAQRRALQKLPPGHLFVAVREQRITLRGEVGSEAAKRSLLDEALTHFDAHRIHDDLRVVATRRPEADFPPLSTALLPSADTAEKKAYHLALSGEAWQLLDWRGSREEPSWKKDALPADFDAALLRADNATLTDWLQGGPDPAPASVRTQPAFIALTLFDDKAILSGQVAESALHAQLLHAAQQAYGSGSVVDADAFTIRAHCESSVSILHTAQGLPPRQQTPTLAIATPGDSWSIIPLTPALLEPGALTRSGLLPKNIPANLIETAAADALEQLRNP